MEDEHVQDALLSRLCRAVIARVACTRAGPASHHELLRHQRRLRQGRATSAGSPAPTSICQTLAQAAGAGGKTWRAYLSTQGAGGGQRARPHRQGPVDERQGRGHREERRRAARRQQPHQADRAHREGRGGQRPRRHAEHARHPDRLAAGRHGVPADAGHDLRQLDQERRAAPRWSATTTARASTTARRRSRGTRRIPRAVRRRLQPGRSARAPAAPACSTASRPTERLSEKPGYEVLLLALGACRRNPARAMRRVQLRGGARRQPARRTFCTLSRLSRAPTKQMGPSHRSLALRRRRRACSGGAGRASRAGGRRGD